MVALLGLILAGKPMTTLSIRQFGGAIPRLAPQALPENAGQEATNCDFSNGELRSLRGTGQLRTTATPVKSLFTDDGNRFFVWSTPTRAYRSPTFGDMYDRIYYANKQSGFRVAQASNMRNAANSPSEPTQSWQVGVARPSVAPVAEMVVSQGWNGDLEAHLSITGVVVAGAAEIKEIALTSFNTIASWMEYVVTVPESEMVVAQESTTPVLTPITTSFGMAILLPEPVVAIVDGSAIQVNSGAALSSAGIIRPTGGVEITLFPSAVQFRGQTYAPNELYTLLTTAPTQASVSQAVNDVELTFRFRVFNPTTAVTYYEGTASATKEGVDTYRVKPQYDASLIETVAYVTTFENDWGEESAPSDPIVLDLLPYQDVIIKQWYMPFAGRRDIAGMNLYRTYGGTATYFKANVVPRTEKVTDTDGVIKWAILDATTKIQTTTTLETEDWDPPPLNLDNLTYCGNGFFVGSVGRDLYFSEPYRPHAWPYVKTLPTNVKGIVAIEGGVLVTTEQQPYIVYGARPDQVGDQELNAEQAGVSGTAISRVEGSAVYASNDGLVMVSGGRADITASQRFFTRELWRSSYKGGFGDMCLGAHDGKVVCVFGSGLGEGFILRLDENENTHFMNLRFENDVPISVTALAVSDALFVGFDRGFAEFGSGELLTCTWHSRDFVYPEPVFFGAGKLRGEGDWRLEVIANGETIVSHTIELYDAADGEFSFRLPPVGSKKRWSVRLTGKGRVRSVELGSSFQELKNA